MQGNITRTASPVFLGLCFNELFEFPYTICFILSVYYLYFVDRILSERNLVRETYGFFDMRN